MTKIIPKELKSHIKQERCSRTGMTRWFSLTPEAWAIIDKTQFSGRTVYRQQDGLLMTKDGKAGTYEIFKALYPLRKPVLRSIK